MRTHGLYERLQLLAAGVSETAHIPVHPRRALWRKVRNLPVDRVAIGGREPAGRLPDRLRNPILRVQVRLPPSAPEEVIEEPEVYKRRLEERVVDAWITEATLRRHAARILSMEAARLNDERCDLVLDVGLRVRV